MTTSARDGLTIHKATIERMERREQEVAGLEGRLQASREQVRQQEQVIKSMRGQRDPVAEEQFRVANDEWLKATKEVANLKMFLKEASDTINGQDQVIKGREEGMALLRNDLQSVRKVRDRLYDERDDLKKQIEAERAVAILTCDEASVHIVKQDKEIALLERGNRENCDIAGAHIVRIVRMSRNIKDLQKECYMKDSDIKQLGIRLANCGYYAELATKNGGFQVGLSLNNIKVEADISTDASQATNVKTGEVYVYNPFPSE